MGKDTDIADALVTSLMTDKMFSNSFCNHSVSSKSTEVRRKSDFYSWNFTLSEKHGATWKCRRGSAEFL